MIEKRHQLLFEKRQPMFHSGEPSPVADRLIERIAGGGRAEDFTIAASETLDALCVQQGFGRSEEHTSELQSLMRISYAVFCLKKKKSTKTYLNHVKLRHMTTVIN